MNKIFKFKNFSAGSLVFSKISFSNKKIIRQKINYFAPWRFHFSIFDELYVIKNNDKILKEMSQDNLISLKEKSVHNTQFFSTYLEKTSIDFVTSLFFPLETKHNIIGVATGKLIPINLTGGKLTFLVETIILTRIIAHYTPGEKLWFLLDDVLEVK